MKTGLIVTYVCLNPNLLELNLRGNLPITRFSGSKAKDDVMLYTASGFVLELSAMCGATKKGAGAAFSILGRKHDYVAGIQPRRASSIQAYSQSTTMKEMLSRRRVE